MFHNLSIGYWCKDKLYYSPILSGIGRGCVQPFTTVEQSSTVVKWLWWAQRSTCGHFGIAAAKGGSILHPSEQVTKQQRRGGRYSGRGALGGVDLSARVHSEFYHLLFEPPCPFSFLRFAPLRAGIGPRKPITEQEAYWCVCGIKGFKSHFLNLPSFLAHLHQWRRERKGLDR